MARFFLALAVVVLALGVAAPAASAIPPPAVTMMNMEPPGGGCVPGNVMYLYNGSGYDIFYCVYGPPHWIWIGRT